MKILIVDDNEEDRRLLAIYLRHKNCEILEAADGREALDTALLHRPDIIISDALMPTMDGFQLLHEVTTSSELSSIPFIFYSSTYTAEREVELALSLGAVAFIAKPKEPAEFWAELSSAMERCQRSEHVVAPPPAEKQYLREYSTIVAAKLEEKCRELEKLNASLQESEARHRALFENTPATMLLLDPDTAEILDLNTAAAEFYGYAREELRRMHITDLCMAPFEELASLAEAKRGPQHVERQQRLHSGMIRDVEIYRGPIAFGNKTIVFSIVHDISERKSLENQLRQAQKMEAVGTLSGGIAHDFNNILTVIVGFVSLAKDILTEDKDGRISSYLDNIFAAATRAANMIKSLLVFSRNQPLEMKPVNLCDAVMGVKKLLERLIQEDIELVVQKPEETVLVMADEAQIAQVLMNLTSNARAAMPHGGRISIHFGRVLIDEDFISSRGFGDPGHHAVLTFTDTGEGMDEETRRRIFEPFFTTKPVGEGTGLGLSTAYGIVKQHCGWITCTSTPGKGTIFNIYLPLIQDAPQEAQRLTHPIPVRGTETILLAEDDEMVRALVSAVLEEHGYTVIEAVNGDDAVERFMENAAAIQLVISDVIMPKKSGLQVVTEIRALAPEMKILLLSGYQVKPFQPNGGFAKGMVITKPISPPELLVKVREAIDA